MRKAFYERGVRVHNDLFLPPNGADGWPRDVTFNVVYTRDTREVKRKMGEAQVKGPNCFLNYFSDMESVKETLKVYKHRKMISNRNFESTQI